MQTTLNLPSNRQIEAEVLGCCFAEDSSNLLNVRAVLSANDFVLDDHREIFATLVRIADAGCPLTVANAYEDLRAHSRPVTIGFLSDLEKGMDFALEGNMRRLRDLTTRRRMMLTASTLLHQAADLTASIDEVAAAAMRSMKASDNASGTAETGEEIIAEAGGIAKFLAPKHGIGTPWSGLNQTTGGWQRGELALLAARPSMGKTALAINAIAHAAARGIPSVFYTYEMSKESILKRIICLLASISYQDLARDELAASERRFVAEATAELSGWPLRIVNASGKTALALSVHAERLQRQGKLELAAIDYIGLIHAGDRQQNRNQELGEICRQLKEMAGELNVPLLVLSQLSRAPETRPDKRPVQSDLRDSGELENHADLIAFLHRPGYYDRNNPALRLIAELIIAKQRNGDTPTLALNFRREYGRFEQPATEFGERCA
jgi:replicative DNA helicase